jgi:AcrR family transcriptional regulator
MEWVYRACIHVNTVVYGTMTNALTSENWVSHGLAVLAKQGFGALKADILAKSLKVTRGSFYWHFKDVAAYHNAVIELWRQRTTNDIIAQINTVSDGAKRLPTLLRTAFGSNTGLDKAMRAWALSEPAAKQALGEVEAIRVQYIEQLLSAANVPNNSVETRAHILHWAFIGYSNSYGDIPEDPTAILDEVIAFALSDSSR